MIYSDDHGASWHKAGALTDGGECQVAQIRPGKLIATARNGQAGYTYIAYSFDDGLSWKPSVANHDLRSPIDGVEASIVAHPNGKLYHSAPDSFLLRSKMVIKVSADEGVSWTNHLHPWQGSAGYSALTVLGEANDRNAPLGLLYDRNNVTMIVFEARGVTFMDFSP